MLHRRDLIAATSWSWPAVAALVAPEVRVDTRMSDGNAHSPHNVPLVLGGRGGGSIASGRYVKYEKDAPLSNLWRSMLSRVGAPVDLRLL